jgi:hypothetical protein
VLLGFLGSARVVRIIRVIKVVGVNNSSQMLEMSFFKLINFNTRYICAKNHGNIFKLKTMAIYLS